MSVVCVSLRGETTDERGEWSLSLSVCLSVAVNAELLSELGVLAVTKEPQRGGAPRRAETRGVEEEKDTFFF